MLRKGIVALMISVMSVSSLHAADGKNSNSLTRLFRGPSVGRPHQRVGNSGSASGGVKHAVVADVDRQVPEIRQTSALPQKPALQPAESTPQPTPVQYSANVPHVSPQSNPEYFAQGSSMPNAVAQGQHTAPVAMSGVGGQPYQFASSGVDLGTLGQMIGPVGMPYGGGHHLPNGGYLAGNDGTGATTAPLYPAPRPGIPHQVGGTAIVHPFLHPHEMLYAHRYKSMYGPYYYKVHGKWMLTPFGVWSKEHWRAQGTTVDVKYKSHISKFALFHPPMIR